MSGIDESVLLQIELCISQSHREAIAIAGVKRNDVDGESQVMRE